MGSKIAIVGAGMISALGAGVKESAKNLENKAFTGSIAPIKYLKTAHRNLPSAEVKYATPALKKMAGLPLKGRFSRASTLSLIAAKEAVNQAFSKISFQNKKVAFIDGATARGRDITKFLGVKINFTDTLSTACSSGANAIAFGAELLKYRVFDIVIAGGCEALTKYHLNGFNSLMILSHKECRPFDAEREGLNLGEGAAYLVMARAEDVKDEDVIGELKGWGNACDAFHQTASSPGGIGAAIAMERALQMATLHPSKIDYINAHGTATLNNDLSEAEAVKRVFGFNVPPISSTKGLTGHTTSASGAIEAVISLIALNEGFMPANRGFSKKDKALAFEPVREAKRAELQNVLSNSFGFGGNDTSLIFSKFKGGFQKEGSKVSRGRENIIVAAKACGIEYSEGVLPVNASIRRLSPALKNMLATALQALKKAGLEKPDAIITATKRGCRSEVLQFEKEIKEQKECSLKPSFFINSTPNTFGAQIAIALKCHGYNTTHAFGNKATKGALLEGRLLLERADIKSVLINIADKTPKSFVLKKKEDYV